MTVEFLDWYRKLWSVERCDDERAVAASERRLGVRFPPLLRAMYLQTSLRDSQMMHLAGLDGLEIRDGVLVFAHEQQRCWSWGIELARLSEPDPALVANPNGAWEDERCTLEPFLRFFALTNRPYEPPCTEPVDLDPDRLAKMWQPHRVDWRSIQHVLWTNGEAVLEARSGDLGARDAAALRRAAKTLGIDPEDPARR